MAASIYATPPPDLSSEDTALSDVSNTSSILSNNRNNNNNSTTTATTTLTTSTITTTTTTTTATITTTTTTTTTTSSHSITNNHNHNYNNNNNSHSHNNKKNNADENNKIRRNKNNHINHNNNNSNSNSNNNNNNNNDNNKNNYNNNNSNKTTDTLDTCNEIVPTTAATTTLDIITTTPTTLTTTTTAQDITALDIVSNETKNIEKCSTNISADADQVISGAGATTVNATTAAMAAFAAAANAAMQLKWLESLNEAAKKRRKQNHPNRLSDATTTDATAVATGLTDDSNGATIDGSNGGKMCNYLEENFQKMFQFKETFELLKRQQQQQQPQLVETTDEFVNISQQQQQQFLPDTSNINANAIVTAAVDVGEQQQQQQQQQHQTIVNNMPYYTYCKRCGENFENDIQLSIHMLQEHNHHHHHHHNHHNNNANKNINYHGENITNDNNDAEASNSSDSNEALNLLSAVNVKLEQPDYDEVTTLTDGYLNDKTAQQQQQQHQHNLAQNVLTNDQQQQQATTNNATQQQQQQQQQQNWPMVPAMMPGFPFGPEAAAAAAAALSARGYLPLLGMPGFSAHPGMEGLNRPPLRIFNPEAYCDLCNKEFCNKYFLRKHKSNKHGIYDPLMATGVIGGPGGGGGGVILGVSNINDGVILSENKIHLQQQQQQLNVDMQQQQQQQQQPQHSHQLVEQTASFKIDNNGQQQLEQQTTTSSLASAATASTSGTSTLTILPAVATIFCDICSKRFTNNFALWRHRAKAHEQQIATTLTTAATTITTTATTTITAITTAALTTVATTTTPNATDTNVKTTTTNIANCCATTPTTTTTLGATTTSAATTITSATTTLTNATTTTTTTAAATVGSMCTVATKSLLQAAKDEQQLDMECAASMDLGRQLQLTDTFRNDYNLEQEEVNFTPQPRQLSPKSVQQARESNFAHEKLKRLGVLNPDAFCELCGKEYCNKYFLRTHKLKRHGLLMPADDAKEAEQQQLHFKSWPFMGLPSVSAPLNFMLSANENAVVVQRMLAAAAAANTMSGNVSLENNAEMPPTKRIKLEAEEQETTNSEEESLKSMGLDADVTLQNLQKLQSMIQQLNAEPGVKQTLICRLCGRELEHQYALHAHIISEHNGSGLEAFPMLHPLQQALPAQQIAPLGLELPPHVSSPSSSELRCHQCERDFSTLLDFKQHIREIHLTPGNALREDFISPERPGTNASGSMGVGNSARPPYTITPTSSYCEICNKELCNKYFMKTHMQRMHGIEIENGAQIGGVVCNICNKELCSKYFLRVHKQNTHGIVEDGVPLPQPRQQQNGLAAAAYEAQQQQQQQQQQQLRQQQQQQQQQQSQPIQQQQQLDNEFARGLNMSPFDKSPDAGTEHCPLCPRRFRNLKLMRAHLLSDHGNGGLGAEKLEPLSKSGSPTLKIPNGANATALNMPSGILPHKCALCPFTTLNYTLFYMHEITHTLSRAQNCETPSSALETDNEPTNLSTRTTNQTPHKYLESMENSVSLEQKLTSLRTTATSPIFPALQELAKQHSKPVSYALPKELPASCSGAEEQCSTAVSAPHQMQAFLLEAATNAEDNGTPNNEEETYSRFVPAIIYLPVREHCAGPLTVSFKLTPF